MGKKDDNQNQLTKTSCKQLSVTAWINLHKSNYKWQCTVLIVLITHWLSRTKCSAFHFQLEVQTLKYVFTPNNWNIIKTELPKLVDFCKETVTQVMSSVHFFNPHFEVHETPHNTEEPNDFVTKSLTPSIIIVSKALSLTLWQW